MVSIAKCHPQRQIITKEKVVFVSKHYVLATMKKNKLVLFSMIFLIFIVGFTLMLNGCKRKPSGPSEPNVPSGPSGPSQPGDDEKKEISVIELGGVRVQLLSDSIVRVENRGPKGFENRPSYIVLNRDNYDHVEYTLEKQNGVNMIKTAKYTVHIPDGGIAEDAYITNSANERIWAYSDAGRTDTNVYLPSPSDELKSWYFTDSPRVIPSEYGYSYNEDVVNLQNWDFDNNALDVFVFLPGGDYSQFCSDYTRVTGASEMVTLQTLGYWDSRWYAYSSETALQQIQDYQDKGFSIDVLVIDTDWRASQSSGQGSGGIGYDINTTLFPDMAGFLEECEELGVNICFNDHPEPVAGTTNGLDQSEVEYRDNKLTLILSLGLDYWWYDRNWSVSLNSFDPDVSVYAFGMYAYQWVTAEYLESITDLDEFAERALIMANVDGVLHGKWYYASDISAHRYSIQWTGDIGADSDALAQEIYTSVFGGAEVGLPYMSSDIGGHNQTVTNEMYTRWIQYGALSTICRVHCTHEKYIHQDGRMPWLFGETAEEVAHTYLDMRYRLLPLYYYLARENYDTGLPIMQRVDIQYPQYVEASRNDEYLLGDYILIAPIEETDSKVPDSFLSYLDNNGQLVQGLKAEYYSNNNWSGSPVFTQTESNIYYNWASNGPDGLDLADNFSVKWTGNITIGSRDAILTFFADDAIEVYVDGVKVIDGLDVYDTYLSTPVYKAGSTHSIEVRYAEYSYNAHVYMTYVQQGESACYNTRTVFIPDGTWIDVWTGERYVGPATYTVTHPLETSPIFVREGALVALAPNMSNTNEKDWSEMVLDVYPSANYDAGITLYEDDTKTNAYKSGYYRTTDITMDFDSRNKALLIKIGAAQGEFEGDRAFTNRKWTVRLHTNPGWGSVTSIVVNGKVVDFDFICQSSAGTPFAFSGASLDSDVYEFVVDGSVYESYEIKVFYASSANSQTNTSYEKVEIPFELSFGEAGDAVNFNNSAVDWIAYGENSASANYITKNGLNIFSATSSYDTPWMDGGDFIKLFADGNFSSSALISQKDFSFEINTDSSAKYYVLYLGGYQSTAKLTVRDTAGNVKTVNFGNIDGTYTKRVVIKTTGLEGKLYVTYSMVASEYTKNIYNNASYDIVCYLSMYGAIASNRIPESVEVGNGDVSVESAGSVDATGTANLTQVGDLDWIHFGSNVFAVQKNSGNVLGDVSFANSFKFYDYKMTLSYSDGLEQESNSGSTHGQCSTDSITFTLNVNSSVKQLILYTGAYKGTNKIEIYSVDGTLLASSTPFTAGTTSINKIVTFSIDASEFSIITVKIKNTDSTGNVSLAAIAVSSEDLNADNGEAKTLTVNHLNLDGSVIESKRVQYSTATYKVYANEYSGLVPSHDYVIVANTDTNQVVNIYYSELVTWNGTDVSSSLSGSGTASDPYLIQSGADLKWLDNNMTATANHSGVYFKLTKSIDLGGNSIKIGEYPGWSGQKSFAGIFDGNNCSIRNLNMTESGMGGGLFSMVKGTVKNLTVYGRVTGNDKMVGGIVGWLYNGTLENCSSYVNVTSTGAAETGGVAGTCQGTIIKCTNYGNVTGLVGVGGIAGYASGTLTSCRNYGSINGTSDVDEIFGAVHSSGAPIVTDCGAKYEFFVTDDSIVQDPTDYDYSFAIIGDQQCMVQYARELNSDKYFKKIYDYILNNASSKKIAHVFNLGDIVQTTYEYEPTHTDAAKANMDKEAEFAYKQIARLDGVLDYSLVRGNHDGPEFYEQYYGVNSTYTGYASHIEDYFINSSNSVHYFSAGNLDYMVVTLDFGAGDLAVAWANEVIAAHPNHNVIISTHAYMHRDGNLLANNTLCARKPDGTNDGLYNTEMGAVANNGDDLWNKLVKKHANIVMVLSGHVDTDDVVCTQLTGENGNTVTNLLINPQTMDTRYKSSGGVGAVAMFYFSDGGKTVEVRYYSTIQDAYIKSENQFTFTIDTIPRQN